MPASFLSGERNEDSKSKAAPTSEGTRTLGETVILSFVAERKSTEVLEETLDTQGLTDLFTTPNIGEKDGLAFIPAAFDPCPAKCRGQGVDCGGGKMHRLDVNVREVTMFVIDVDKRPDATFDQLLVSLEDQGLEFWYYETFSHDRSSGLTCGRVVLPLGEPVPGAQWRSVWEGLVKALAPEAADPKCFNPSRIYNLPRHPEAQSRDAGHSPGAPLDWKQYAKPTAVEPQRTEAAPLSTESGASPALLAAAEDHVATHRAKNPTVKGTGNHDAVQVGAILLTDWGLTLDEALPIARRHNEKTFNPRSEEELLQCLENASTYSHNPKGHKRLAFELAQRGLKRAPPSEIAPLEAGTPKLFDVLKARLNASTHAGVHKILNAKAITKGSTRGGKTRSAWTSTLTEISNRLAGQDWPLEMIWQLIEPSWLEEPDAPEAPRLPADTIKAELADLMSSAVSRLEASAVQDDIFRLERARQILNLEGDPFDAGEWLMPELNSQGFPAKYHDASITLKMLRHSTRWCGLAFDQFRGVILFRGVERGVDSLITEIRAWASAHGLPTVNLLESIREVAAETQIDSLMHYYDQLPEHDGIDRLDTFTSRYIDAQCADEEDRYFAAQACRRWLLAMVARAYQPGVKVDNVLILQGRQGLKKSSMFEAFGDQFYASHKLGSDEKEDTRRLRGKHVIELNELATHSSASKESVKAFVTRRSDATRAMHANDFQEYPRRFVIGGTTNETEYFTDYTGNRRFWPVSVGFIEKSKLTAELPQLLSQAKKVYLEAADCSECHGSDRCVNHRWWIDERSEWRLVKAQERATLHRTEEGQIPSMILEQLLMLERAQRPENISVEWVFSKVRGISDDRTKRLSVREVRNALRMLFGEPYRPRLEGRRPLMYRVTEELLNAPKQIDFSNGLRTATHLALAKKEKPE